MKQANELRMNRYRLRLNANEGQICGKEGTGIWKDFLPYVAFLFIVLERKT